MAETIFRGGTIVTLDPEWRILTGDVACRDGLLVQVGGDYMPAERSYEILDAEGCVVLPGLVQGHVNSCHTLARGRVEGLGFDRWLAELIWPYEAALEPEDVAAAGQLAYVELLLGGTTALLDCGPVHHTSRLFEAARDAGIRATIGRSMIDAGEGLPPALTDATRRALGEATKLCDRWHLEERGRLRYAYSPRYCSLASDDLLGDGAAAARHVKARIHLAVGPRDGDAITRLRKLKLLGEDLVIAECWPSEGERDLLRDSGAHLSHSPTCECKLGVGPAPLPALLAAALSVCLGSGSPACGNRLDGFAELELAVLLARANHGAATLPAPIALRMATLGGAEALGLEREIGTLEIGKRADVIAVDLSRPHATTTTNPHTALVHSSRAGDVRHVAVDGRVLVRDHKLLTLEPEVVMAEARKRARRVFDRLRS